MRKILRWSFLFFILASLPALACNLVTEGGATPVVGIGEDAVETGEDSVEDSDDLPTAAPAATVPTEDGDEQPTDDAGSTGETDEASSLPDFGTLSENLSQLNSYRTEIEVSFDSSDDPAQSGTLAMNTARVSEPPASYVEVTVSGSFAEAAADLSEGATISFTEIGDESYSIVPLVGCISGAIGGAMVGQFSSFLNPGFLLGEVENAEFVGEETIDGVATSHYRFDQDDLPQSDESLREVTGDVFVAQESAYVVRMIVDGAGNTGMFGQGTGQDGTFHLEYNVLDAGEPITIEPPPNC